MATPGTLDGMIGALRLIPELDVVIQEMEGVLRAHRDALEGRRTLGRPTLLFDTRAALRAAENVRDRIRPLVAGIEG